MLNGGDDNDVYSTHEIDDRVLQQVGKKEGKEHWTGTICMDVG